MTQHTPGPWQVLPEEADKDYIRVRGTRLGGKYKIANVPVTNEFDVEEARMIAKRIAAVPEMYEIVREVAGDILHSMPSGEPDCRCSRCRRIRFAGDVIKRIER